MKFVKPTIAMMGIVLSFAGWSIIDGGDLAKMIEGIGMMLGALAVGLFAISLPDE